MVCFSASTFDPQGISTELEKISFLTLSTNAKMFYFTATKLISVPVAEDPISVPGIEKFDFSILNVQALDKIQKIKFFSFDFLILNLSISHFKTKINKFQRAFGTFNTFQYEDDMLSNFFNLGFANCGVKYTQHKIHKVGN